MANLGLTRRRHRREQRQFGRRDRCLVHVERGAVQSVGCVERVRRALDGARPQRRQRLHVRGERAARGEIAAGCREMHFPATRKQRPHQQQGRADPPDQDGVRRGPGALGASQGERAGATPRDRRPEALEQVEQHVHVADAWHVVQRHGLARQQRRDDERQRRVLVALDGDHALEASSSLHAQHGHVSGRFLMKTAGLGVPALPSPLAGPAVPTR